MAFHPAVTDPVYLMGIVNCTPDSFAGPQRPLSLQEQLDQAAAHAAAGAHFIDIGGESTRPGSHPVSVAEEEDRILPLFEALRRHPLPLRLSVDTTKAQVARAALAAGASMVNDVSALSDLQMAEAVKSAGASLILMHMAKTPATMQQRPHYVDLFAELERFFAERRSRATAAGIDASKLWFDPGLGFGKTLAHNLQILSRLPELTQRHQPICLGPSRKAFLGALTGHKSAAARDPATAAAVTAAVLAGVRLLRVHHLPAIKDAVAVALAIRQERAAHATQGEQASQSGPQRP
jgi:dihydropteroate synthase